MIDLLGGYIPIDLITKMWAEGDSLISDVKTISKTLGQVILSSSQGRKVHRFALKI